MLSIRLALIALSATFVFAQSDTEPAAILELGAAPGFNLSNSTFNIGPTAAVEFTPIENWLEIETGTTPAFTRHSPAEWDTDLLFKKPWTISRKAEFMIGLGPQWVHIAGSNLLAGEFALDFMFWPTPGHRFGWYLEPAYSYTFGPGHERSIGLSAGLLIAIP